MEEYLQYMRTLRTQMNDVEDLAAKTSVEEQMLTTTIHTLEKDIASAKEENKRFADETDQMVNTRGHICSKIIENQKRIASMESDACTLSQTLELNKQERSNLSAKILDKRTYYSKVVEDLTSKLQEQQNWLDNNHQSEVYEVKNWESDLTEGISGEEHPVVCNLGDGDKELLLKKFQSANTNLEEIIHLKTKLVSENHEIKQAINELKNEMNEHKMELIAMDMVQLEEEHKALLSEKTDEMEYLHTFQIQVEKLRGISHVITCACGGELKVEVSHM